MTVTMGCTLPVLMQERGGHLSPKGYHCNNLEHNVEDILEVVVMVASRCRVRVSVQANCSTYCLLSDIPHTYCRLNA